MTRVAGPLSCLVVAPLLAVAVAADDRPSGRNGPQTFAFFEPTLEVPREDQVRLESGGSIVRILPADAMHVAVFAAVRVDVTAERLVAHVRNIAELKRGPLVSAIRRFSMPPVADDLADLALEEADLADLERCRPGDCGVKLTAAELVRLRRVIDEAGRSWRAAVQAEFRAVVLARVAGYLAEGHGAFEPLVDQDEPARLEAAFGRLLDGSPHLTQHLPRFADFLRGFPRIRDESIESFLYWSKEHIGGRATISVTHVNIRHGRGADPKAPEVVVVGKQVFATHYTNGSLSLTTVLSNGPHTYLAYLNRSEVDAFGGMFGWLKRAVVERRVRQEAGRVLAALSARLERQPAPTPR